MDKVGESEQSATLDDLIHNYARRGLPQSEKFKIRPLGEDFVTFNDVMDRKPKQENRLYECYDFFKTKAEQWLTNRGNELSNAADALVNTVVNKLQFVAIELEDRENPYRIFEALNARGEPLSEWEKVKNYLLYTEQKVNRSNQYSLYDRHLRFFDDIAWMKEAGSGANRRRLSDIFLDYWLESSLKRPIEVRRVFREFRDHIEKTQPDVFELSERLEIGGRHFMEWETGSSSEHDVEALFHSRRRSLNIGAIWPALLALSRTTIDNEDRERCFRVLDSYLWRRAIVGLTTRNYDAVALEIVGVIQNVGSARFAASDALIDFLLKQDERGRLWPNDQRVKRSLLDEQLYGEWAQRNVRVLLEAIERALMRGKRPSRTEMEKGRPIEHLMPQRRNGEDWPLSPDSAEDAEEMRDELIHKLGNLTLVEHGLNSKLGNKPWRTKRAILYEQDNLYINKELLLNAPENVWNEDQINRRGERLAEYVCTIWPHGERVNAEIERILT